MELYLIRHGLAGTYGSYTHDADRPLTEEGVQKTKRVAKRLYELGLRFDLIQTSPLVRARQTAEILQKVHLSEQLQQSKDLAPSGNLAAWLDWLQTWQQAERRLAIVGHEPNLGEWAEQLVWGEARQQLVVKKAGVMGLTVPDEGMLIGRCQLFWLTPPRFLLND